MSDESPSSWRATLAWAIFAACAWTWCIGLFLPVLLVRDFGLAGWAVFAIPNVVGAASVGFMCYAGGANTNPVAVNRQAMGWFSVITIAFHVFFNLWFVPRLLGGMGVAMFVVASICFYVYGRARPRLDLTAAGATLALSALAAVVFVFAGKGLPTVKIACPNAIGLTLLSPSIILGFLLCPHLDLTLHRAKQAAHPRAVFMLGFGVIFLALIAFSLFYAPALAGVTARGHDAALPAPIAQALGAYMAVQSALTVALHLRALAAPNLRGLGMPLTIAVLVAIVLALTIAAAPPASIAGAIPERVPPTAPMQWLGGDAGEAIYKSFLVFYALVFPAYAWAAWRCRAAGRRPRVLAWLPAVAAGLPLLAAGYLGHVYAATPVAAALVLVNPLLVGKSTGA